MQNQPSFSWVLGKRGVAPVKNPKRKTRRKKAKRRFVPCKRRKGLKRGKKRVRLHGTRSAARSAAYSKARRLGIAKYALSTCGSATAINALIAKARKKGTVRKGRKRAVRRRSRRRNPRRLAATGGSLIGRWEPVSGPMKGKTFKTFAEALAAELPRYDSPAALQAALKPAVKAKAKKVIKAATSDDLKSLKVGELRAMLAAAGVPCRSTMKKEGLLRVARRLKSGKKVKRGTVSRRGRLGAKWGECKKRAAGARKRKRKSTKRKGKKKAVRRRSKRKGRKYAGCLRSRRGLGDLTPRQAAARRKQITRAKRLGMPAYVIDSCRTATALKKKISQFRRGGGRRRNPMSGLVLRNRRNPFRRNPFGLGRNPFGDDFATDLPIAGRIQFNPFGAGQAFGLTFREAGIAAFGGIAAGFVGNMVRDRVSTWLNLGAARYLGPVLQATGGFWLSQALSNRGWLSPGEATVFNSVNVAAAFDGLAGEIARPFLSSIPFVGPAIEAYGLGDSQNWKSIGETWATASGNNNPANPNYPNGLGSSPFGQIMNSNPLQQPSAIRNALGAYGDPRYQPYPGGGAFSGAGSGPPNVGGGLGSGLAGVGPFGLGESMPSDNAACDDPIYSGLCYGQSGTAPDIGMSTTPSFMQ